ncbi:MAG: energy-coupling factor transporter transmembrane component T [Lachnospiraceae bacterium]
MTGILSVGGSRAVIRLDPRTKLYILLVFSLVTFSASTEGIDGIVKILFACFSFLMILNVRKPLIAVAYAVLYAAAYYGDFLLRVVPTSSVPGVLIRIFIPVILRMMPGIVVAWTFLLSTKVSEFIAGMERLHLTQKITIPFAVIFRFFPTIAAEYHSIQDAMKIRKIGIRKGPVVILEYRLIPLIVSIVKIGDELSAAAVTRGLGGDSKRTNYHQIGFHFWDVALFLFITISLLVFIIF